MTIREDQAFYFKYLLPIVALVMTCVIAIASYTIILNENDLVATSGRIIDIGLSERRSGRSTITRLSITLNTPIQQPYFLDNNQNLFSTILNKIQVGDSIAIFHSTIMQSRFGVGDECEIFTIKKGAEYIYTLKEAKLPAIELRNLLALPAILLWALYFYCRRILKKDKGSRNKL